MSLNESLGPYTIHCVSRSEGGKSYRRVIMESEGKRMKRRWKGQNGVDGCKPATTGKSKMRVQYKRNMLIAIMIADGMVRHVTLIQAACYHDKAFIYPPCYPDDSRGDKSN